MIHGSICQSILSFIQWDTSKDLLPPTPPCPKDIVCLCDMSRMCWKITFAPLHCVMGWSFPPGQVFNQLHQRNEGWKRSIARGSQNILASVVTGIDWWIPVSSTLYLGIIQSRRSLQEAAQNWFLLKYLPKCPFARLNWQLWSHK